MTSFAPISVYGYTGFIGSRFIRSHPSSISIPRNSDHSLSDDVLYLISTNHNYNVFDDPYLDINTNLIKLMSVIDSYRRSGRKGVFNFVSSWFVYGKNCTMDTRESDPCDPRGFYSITKRAAEQLLVSYCETYSIEYRIFRLTNILGHHDHTASSKKNAMQYMIGLLKEGKPVNLYEGGNCYRDFMLVDDACRAIRTCLSHAPKNEIINISDSQPITIKEAVMHAKMLLKSDSDLVSIPTPEFHRTVQVKDVCLNNEKLISYGYKKSTMSSIDVISNVVKGMVNDV